jgi:NAD(P)-dependent dehydrogenase (short-subunit alcohol dehydrogenase family)
MHLWIEAEAQKHTVEAHNRDTLDQTKDFFKLDGEPIDVLVLNAAIKDSESNTTLTTSATDMAEVYNTNVIGSLRVLQALEHRLHPGSKVVFITSQAGTASMTGGITVHGVDGSHYIPPTYSLAYRCSKAAENMLIRCAALDLKHRGIIVFGIDPGWLKTTMGGPFANTAVSAAANGIVHVIDNAEEATHGAFLEWTGRPLKW